MATNQIDYCIEVARTLNFSRVADNLFVSQPTFSYQIRLLEEEVGFTIFERNGKWATLTPAGAQFVSFLTGMRQDLKRAVERGQSFSAKYKDSISICLMVRKPPRFLFFLLFQFRTERMRNASRTAYGIDNLFHCFFLLILFLSGPHRSRKVCSHC